MRFKDIEYRGINGIPTNKEPCNAKENDMSGWRVMKPVIDLDKCKQCKKCFVLCPDVAIYWMETNLPSITYSLCKGCGICAQECPVDAIEMVKE